MPGTTELLEEIDAADPHERAGRAAAAAPALGEDERRALLADLAGREVYHRHLAVFMAGAAGDTDHLVAALGDPHPGVRAHAVVVGDLPEDTLVRFMQDASRTDRLTLYARLRRGRPTRATLAERLLPLVRDRWGDVEAARVLPACSAGAVAEALPELAYAVTNWTSLIARYPTAVLAQIEAELSVLDPEARTAWWSRTGRLQQALAQHRPAALLELCERFVAGRLPWPVVSSIGRLLAVDPRRVARLVLADPQRGPQLAQWRLTQRVRDRLAALPDADLGALLRASGPEPQVVASVLGRLPPTRREAVFEAAYAGRDLTAQVLPDEVVAVLPHWRRQAEARRMLALPAVANVPAEKLRITAFLPYAEAFPALREATRSARAEDRARGYELLVRCAAGTGDPAVVTELLAGLTRIGNEQDPVRSRLLGALAEVRPELFTPSSVDALDALVTGALNARDTSWQSSLAVSRLLFGALWHAASGVDTQPLLRWALEAIERVGGWRQMPTEGDLRRTLRRGQEHAVFARLRPTLAHALRRNEVWPLLSFARSLGRRAWDMPDLQELIGEATRISDSSAAAAAISVWLRPPRGRAERAAALVARDESTITRPEVLAVVVRRDSGLINRLVLAGRSLRGAYDTGEAWWLPAVHRRDLDRWTPEQVQRYAGLLVRAIADDELDRWRRAWFARALAGLPGSGAAVVEDLIAGADVLIAEGALTGLAQTDRPDQALRILLRNLHGDRARVAVFAASACARDVAPSRLAQILGGVLVDEPKVTVRKEAARLLSQLRVPGAVDLLLDAWRREGQHRDVRVAVAAAVRAWPEDPRSWAVLEEAAAGERFAAVTLLDADPPRMAERHRERYAVLVRRLTRHPDQDVARQAYTTLADWAPWAPQSATEIAAGVTDMAEGPTWRFAAGTALTPAVWSALPDLLPDITATLLRLAATDPDAERLRDLPARQRIGELVRGVCRRPQEARRNPAPVRRMIELLAAEPTFRPAAARLGAVLLWPGPRFVADLGAVADLLADLPLAVPELDTYLTPAAWEPDDVGPGVDALARRGDASGGLLAVTLTTAAGARAGWPAPWRDRLRALRRHPAAEVRHRALAVITAVE